MAEARSRRVFIGPSSFGRMTRSPDACIRLPVVSTLPVSQRFGITRTPSLATESRDRRLIGGPQGREAKPEQACLVAGQDLGIDVLGGPVERRRIPELELHVGQRR